MMPTEVCGECGSAVKVYRRKLNSQMAVWLLNLIRRGGGTALHPREINPSGAKASSDGTYLRHWGLVKRVRDLWMPTADGLLFAHGTLSVQRYARIRGRNCYGLEGDLIDIKTALGSKFDYEELMGDSK